MDPYKVLGISERQVKQPSDLDVARQRAKKLFKRYLAEKKKFDAKKVMEAFEMIKAKLKNKPGEGAYKILGRSRKERELDKHFNHQTKEIKKNKDLKRALSRAKRGENTAAAAKRIHLPGDKERIPRHRKRRHRRSSRKAQQIDALQGLKRLAAVLPQQTKFPKVIKLLHRWMREYMNPDNRDFVFNVLQGITQSEFLLEDVDARQDVVEVFEYAMGYFSAWFDGGEGRTTLRHCWHVATVLACRCFTDDAFVLSATLAKLNEVLALMETHRDDIHSEPRRALSRKLEGVAKEEARAKAKEEPLDAAKEEPLGEAKEELLATAKEESLAAAKEESTAAKVEGGRGLRRGKDSSASLALPVASPPSARGSPGPSGSPLSDEEDGAGEVEEVESLGSSEDIESLGSSEEEVQAIDLGSDSDSIDIKEEEEISDDPSGECESDSGIEMEECPAFTVPDVGESLRQLRAHFVDRCLAALFQQRGPTWARPKIDAFFQDVFYRRSIFLQEQRSQVEAWQARIKDLQKLGDRAVGEANNPLEAHRPVRDSREERVALDADSNVWAAKQTFDSRDTNGARGVIR